MAKLHTYRLIVKSTGDHMGFVVVDPDTERCYINSGERPCFSPVASFAYCRVNDAITRALDGDSGVSVPLRTVGVGTDFDVTKF